MNDSELKRFSAKVQLPEDPTDPDAHWIWIGALGGQGSYGVFWWNGKQGMAHRASYEHFIGPIPKGLNPDHLCRIHACIRPEHLEAVTHKENMLRSIHHTKTECKQGHPFTTENVYTNTRGQRECKTCRRVAFLKWKAKISVGGDA